MWRFYVKKMQVVIGGFALNMWLYPVWFNYCLDFWLGNTGNILLVTVAHNPLRKVEFRYKISNKMLSEKVKKAILVTLNVF